jgi:hypothetical protein
MASPKNPPASGSRNPGADHKTASGVYVVPRAWLAALTALVVVPWLFVAGLYVWPRVHEQAGPAEEAIANGAPYTVSSGRWGRLTIAPIIISPPLEYVAADWEEQKGDDLWFFPGASPDEVERFLVGAGLSPDVAASLRAGSRVDPATGSVVVRPDLPIIRSLAPDVRARIYLHLARSRFNRQSDSLRFFGSADTWLDSDLITQSTRQLARSLIYQDGHFQHFSDVRLIQMEIKDAEERRRLGKVMLRNSTMMVRLTVQDEAEVDELATYWGRGGRRTDLRPLLESVAGAGPDRSIDIIHLLPNLARTHLYRYPKISTADYDRPLLANCLWSALNFLNPAPDDRFLDVDTALNSLRHDYYVVEGDLQLGDIVALVDENGMLFHVAVYLAADLVFTKNGTSRMAPWSITTLEQLTGYYHAFCPDPKLIFHRRNDL